MFDVGLIWKRCPDGVEVFDYGIDERAPVKGLDVIVRALLDQGEEPRYGQYYRARSDRRSPVLRNGIDLENPLVLQLVNASSTLAIAAFLSEKGMIGGREEQSTAEVEDFRSLLGAVVDEMDGLPDGNRVQRINTLLEHARLRAEFDYSGPNQSGRTVFYVEKLGQYMTVEIAAAVMRGAGVVRCAYCESAFFTGPAAHRRSDAKTCSEKCRSALRRRNSIAST